MRKLLVWNTSVGPFYIAESRDGRFHPVFNDQSLGSYVSIRQAVDDLAGGHTFSIRGGVDTSTLGIPADPADWHRPCPTSAPPRRQPSFWSY
jgi:hypothetical protein